VLLWESLLLNHILPSIFDAAASLLFVLLIFKVFRVKNPATRFMFLFLPLFKAFIVFIDSTSTTAHVPKNKFLMIGFRMPDPFGFFTLPRNELYTMTYDHSALVIATEAVVAIILILLAARWVQLFLFFEGFRKAEQVDETEYPQLYASLRNLTGKLSSSPPKLVFSNIYQFVPFSVGYRAPIIVLSRDLVDSFPEEQLEIMLAHELAHIKRKDSFTGWLALILRDVMFFNPLIRLSYRTLEEEKEKVCDRIALEKTGVSPKVIANTLIDVALFHKDAGPNRKRPLPTTVESFAYRHSALEKRIEFITSPMPPSVYPSAIRTSLKTFLFVLLIYIQPVIGLKISQYTLFLR